jgi:hypothetical protein
MIHVPLSKPPTNYIKDVKIPGESFLKQHQNPTSSLWSQHCYWKKVHDYLYASHNGICFYSASWTPRKSSRQHLDATSIDHYIPKSLQAKKAYEWINFRLSRARLNHRKDNYTDVLDPCAIEDGWFWLDFTTFLIKPASGIDNCIKVKVWQTINRLQLNIDQDYVKERIEVIRSYCLSRIPFEQIKNKYPFIAQQMIVQDFENQYKQKLVDFLNEV